MKRFAIIGGGTMAVKCMERILREPNAELVLVLADPARETGASLFDAAQTKAKTIVCPHIRDAIGMLKEARADHLLSIHNHQILDADVLSATTHGAINLHHSALPRYAGLNACSWAILNGESSHGVTWHMMDEAIDNGPILAQTTFPLDEASTAATVMLQVMREGIALFDTLLPRLVAGTASFTPQQGTRSYYAAKEKPFDGTFPFNESYDVLERLSRAIDFHPLPNNFYRPLVAFDGKTREVESFAVEKTVPNAPAGTVLHTGLSSVKIATFDAIATLELV